MNFGYGHEGKGCYEAVSTPKPLEMDSIDNQLVSPIRVAELTRIYDRLVETLSKAQAFNTQHVDVYGSLWLTCTLLEHAKDLLSSPQTESVTETQTRCHLILQISDLYTDAKLEMFSPERLVVEFDAEEGGMLSWKFEQKINLDMDAIAQEETTLVEMANTPIPEKISNDSLQNQWHGLQTRVRQVWGEVEYQKAAGLSYS